MAVYILQFKRVMFEASANSQLDDAKITTLVGGLNKYTKQQINEQMTLPTNYNGFVQMLQTLRNQFRPSNGNSNSNEIE